MSHWVRLALMMAVFAAAYPSSAAANQDKIKAQAELASERCLEAQQGGSSTRVRELCRSAFEGGEVSSVVVASSEGGNKPQLTLDSASLKKPKAKEPEPPAPEKSPISKIPKPVIYGAAAGLGGLQGYFSGGLVGALAGAGTGLLAAHLYMQGDVGGAFGVTAGSMLGSVFGGPLGAVVGAVVGGLLGHFIGKLF